MHKFSRVGQFLSQSLASKAASHAQVHAQSLTHVAGLLQSEATLSLLQVDQYVMERHRHRYEVNPTLVPQLEAAGLHFVGKDDSGARMEILELQNHPFFVACQFHPEFKSRPGKPSALFLGLILAACGKLDGYLTGNTIKSPARPPPRKSARLPDGTPLPTC